MDKPDLNAERLRKLLNYNKETGIFTWSNSRLSGKRAGGNSSEGYRHIKVDGTLFYEHRLAWLYVYGVMPQMCIDHINNNRNDNRFSNIRQCDYSENQQNLKKATKNSKSGFLGVVQITLKSGALRWFAKIKIRAHGIKYLGRFDSPELAYQAYLNAKRELHPFGTI